MHRLRQWGACWLALMPWERLERDSTKIVSGKPGAVHTNRSQRLACTPEWYLCDVPLESVDAVSELADHMNIRRNLPLRFGSGQSGRGCPK